MQRRHDLRDLGDDAPGRAEQAAPWAAIEAAVRSVRYGSVVVVVQDGRVVQIEKTEKIRLV